MTPDKDKAEIKRGKQLSIRQYRHNHGDGFVFGYDTDQMDALLASLQARIEELEANASFYKSCALSGEIPSPGAEPYPPTDSDGGAG